MGPAELMACWALMRHWGCQGGPRPPILISGVWLVFPPTVALPVCNAQCLSMWMVYP